MNSFVASDIPAEFMITSETIRTAGKAITEAETEVFLNKYGKNIWLRKHF